MERYVEGVKSGWRKSERASGFAKGNPSRSSSSEELREELVRVSEIWAECQPPTSFFETEDEDSVRRIGSWCGLGEQLCRSLTVCIVLHV